MYKTNNTARDEETIMKIFSSSIDSFLKSLVVLSLLLTGYVTSTKTKKPSAVNHYGDILTPPSAPISNGDNDNDGFGFFDIFHFGSIFGKQQPNRPGDGGGEEIPPEYEEGSTTKSLGYWKIHSQNAGVAAMHIQLMPNGKAIMYDSTSNGLSEITLDPPSCAPRVGGRQTDPEQDCTAHAIEYDVETAQIRTLKLETSPWCSSGGLNKNGDLVSTGGDKAGFQSVRLLKHCKNCNFQENQRALYSNRWYATQVALDNGSFALVGGRNAYSYEIIPPDTLTFTPQLMELPLLEDTDDDAGRENNLYPFVNLLPDGNLFVFANYKSIVLNPYTAETVRVLPDLPGGSRNYPPSAMSALLPINLDIQDQNLIKIEVLICGGNTRESYILADLQQPKRTFLEAAKDCGRLNLNVENRQWEKEDMPSPRVMGDMLLLPNGDVLMINGAKAGTSAWNAAKDPNLTPVLYSPNKRIGERFKELAPTVIPRMYHSVSAVLPSGEILVAGSNTNPFYMLEKYEDDFTFSSELRVEKFYPPYMAPDQIKYRLEILRGQSENLLKYGVEFGVAINAKGNENIGKNGYVKVTMYSPPFTTHGYSQNQRLLILKLKEVTDEKITAVAPPSPTLAPPGYYLLFVVYRDVPSRGIWVHIQ
ncbi:glyoxal oxidase-related protein [Striga asiatica]|uniref:Glyoxal oxidase-related protein n=1 Tax=Striga asiatica TaxID=4170 RepID=A0A5A7P7W9_STRAF|nr:glyoxal oxidase-related protein [Striga asiatica]